MRTPRAAVNPSAHPGHGARAARRASALRDAHNAQGELDDGGFPTWAGLRPVLLFLMFPAMFAFAILVTGGEWEPEVLYPIAGLIGLYVFWTAFRGAELVIACLLLYLPFSSTYVIPVAPGVNGTNMLLLLGLFASVLRATDRRQEWVGYPAGTSLVLVFAVLSTLSGFTVLQLPGGWSHLVHGELLSYKAWIDQFLFYFVVASCIRDVETAKRVMVYMGIGAVVLVLYAVPEMLAKMGRSTIEKSRIVGPHRQSNNFGGFVAYTLLPVVAYFMVNIRDLRAWLLTPYFLLAAKVLISTFSRGAYLAVALGGLLAGFLKGKAFLSLWAALVLCFFLAFPRFIPESIMVRLQSITEAAPNTYQAAELDKSSASRLILWAAAVEMMKEDPLLGKGFKAFPKLKAEYTEIPVRESDPHSMYLYIGSQMGVPALLAYLGLLGWSFWLGCYLSRHGRDRFVRAIGIGGGSATGCFAVICLFGSRAVNLEFTAYFWATLVVMQVLYQAHRKELDAVAPSRRRRTALDVVRKLAGQWPGVPAGGRAARAAASQAGSAGSAVGAPATASAAAASVSAKPMRRVRRSGRATGHGPPVARSAEPSSAGPAAPSGPDAADGAARRGRRPRRGAIPPPQRAA